MNDRKENVSTGGVANQHKRSRVDADVQGLASLSEWAEFSFLIQKLDGEYASFLDDPLESQLAKFKLINT